MQTVEAQGHGPGGLSDRTYFNLVARFGDGVRVWFIDITAHKHTEHVLQQQGARAARS